MGDAGEVGRWKMADGAYRKVPNSTAKLEAAEKECLLPERSDWMTYAPEAPTAVRIKALRFRMSHCQ